MDAFELAAKLLAQLYADNVMSYEYLLGFTFDESDLIYGYDFLRNKKIKVSIEVIET